MRRTCLNMVHELARQDDRVLFIGSDLGVGTLDDMRQEFPDRFFMEGVSEAHLAGFAAGLAMEGYIPYFNTIATFITRRCYEQDYLDLGLHRTKVRLIGNGGGLVYAPLGPTHQAIEDIALMRSIPGMTIIAPADAEEMKSIMPLTLDIDGPVYIRLAKGGDEVVTTEHPVTQIGQAIRYATGKHIDLICTGICLQIALEVKEVLAQHQIDAGILHCPTIKPLDLAAIQSSAKEHRLILSLEEHVIHGGLGSAIAEILSEIPTREKACLMRMGIPDTFAENYGSQAELLSHFGLDAKTIAAKVLKEYPNYV